MTLSFWIKRNRTNSGGIQGIIGNSSGNTFFRFNDDADGDELRLYHPNGSIYWPINFRDVCKWYNIVLSINTGANGNSGDERVKLYVNGVHFTETRSYTAPNHNADINWSSEDDLVTINGTSTNSQRGNHQMCDFFFVDGQTLNADVFGFFKNGEGYTTAGNNNEAKKIPGVWRPKPPRAIKKTVEEGGGFGSNGWYLPMNDEYCKGMDFHMTPDTILKINDHLPQPKGGLRDGKIEVREDPLAKHLALAVPFVHGGLQNGMGDYSHIIRGEGSAMNMVNSSAKLVQQNFTNSSRKEAAFYRSAGELGHNGNVEFVKYGPSGKFDFNGDDFTIEAWFWPQNDQSGNARLWGIKTNSSDGWDCYMNGSISNAGRTGAIYYSGNSQYGGPGLPTKQWNHVVSMVRQGYLYTIINGICQQRVDVQSITTFGAGDKYLQVGMIGEDYSQDQYCFRGFIQDLRVYNCAKYSGGFDCPLIHHDHDFAGFSAISASTPRNTFATWNYLNNDNTSVSRSGWDYGATDVTWSTVSGQYEKIDAILGASTGKWYYEIRFHDATVSPGVMGAYANGPTLRVDNGRIYLGGSQLQSGLTGQAAGQIFGVAFDVDAKTVQFYLNGAAFGSQHTWGSSSQIDGAFMFPMVQSQNSNTSARSQVNFGDNPTFSGRLGIEESTFKDASGHGTFRYQPPEGYKALCTANLPDPPVKDPSKFFSIVRYRGNGNVGRKVKVGFDPALCWIKPTNFSDQWVITTSVGPSVRFSYFGLTDWSAHTNSNNGRIFSHDSDGFSAGTWNNINDPDDTYIAYCWKGGGNTHKHNKDGVGSDSAAGVNLHNSQGDWTISPTRSSINTTSGFSAIEYTGTAGGSVPHGLGVAPQWVMIKGHNSDHWFCYHSHRDGTEHYYMNTNNNNPGSGLITTPTSTHIQLGNDGGICGNGTEYRMFCWAQVDGMTRMGKYIGNGNSDGPFVYCGFRPAMVIVTSTDNTGSWTIWDNMRDVDNPMDHYIHPNETMGTGSYSGLHADFTSNGFKARMTHQHMNASGDTYQFIAFAESHIKYSNGR